MAENDILVIDDESVILDAVEKIGSAYGWRVKKAIDSDAAFAELSESSFRLIVCDIMMPKLDGFQILEELRKRKVKTPLVMSTGFSTLENAVKSLNKGAIDFIPKPFTFEELAAHLSRGLNYSDMVIKIGKRTGEEDTLEYIPCPSRYYRLGYASWASFTSDGLAVTGISDLFLKTIGEIEKIEIRLAAGETAQGEYFVTITDNEGYEHSPLFPLSGKVIETNDEVINNPLLLQKDPYFEGWLMKIIPSEKDYEINNLFPCSSNEI